MQGKLASYRKNGDSGKPITRLFCPECGSSVADEGEGLPGIVMLAAGTLDDPSWLKPRLQIYCDSQQPWLHLGDMKSFPRTPR